MGLSLSVAFPVLLFMSSCSIPDSEDPCGYYKKPIPGFLIQSDLDVQYQKDFGTPANFDTISVGENITITSSLNYTKYEWSIVGTTGLFRTTKSFRIAFSDTINLELRLIGTRGTNRRCNPNDVGVDTVIRRIVVTQSSLCLGKFTGYDTQNPGYKYGFEILYDKIPPDPDTLLYLRFFPDSCQQPLKENITSNYHLLYINNHTDQGGGIIGCQSPRGWFLFNDDGVDVQYTTKDIVSGGPETKRHFIGKRIK